jgi:putative Holliday junction resolvase
LKKHPAMAAEPHNILALDVGDRRIGVARANAAAGIAVPLTTLERSADSVAEIKKLIETNEVSILVVGLPRGLEGQETAQTRAVRQFVDQLKASVDVPICLQDEALTSRKAEAELQARGKPYEKAAVDALAATYILEDYIIEQSQRIQSV